MKKFLFILFMLPCYAVGQQFLWSTHEIRRQLGSNVDIIPLSNVFDRVMDYYHFYDFYYDLTGFSKDGFNDFLKKDVKTANSIKWDSTMAFDEPAAFAFKGNNGQGSHIVVILTQKENIDLLVFSNDGGRGAILTSSKEKFDRWLSSFWDYGEGVSTYEEGRLSIQHRGWAVPPNIEDNGQQAGVVMVEVRVARDGRITFAQVSLEGTTLTDKALWDKCERAVRSARFNEMNEAPREQQGFIPFRFKLN